MSAPAISAGAKRCLKLCTAVVAFCLFNRQPLRDRGRLPATRDTAVLEALLSAQISKTARVRLSYSGEFAHVFAAHVAKTSLVVDF